MEKSLAVFINDLARLGASPKSNSLIKGGNLFDLLLDKPLEEILGKPVMLKGKQVVDAYFKAVMNCRKNQLAEALIQLNLADSLFKELEAKAKKFFILYQLSAWGNYFYVVKESNKAVELLKEGLSISAALERNGYEALIFRRIEQLQNIANIRFKEGDLVYGYELLKNVMKFIYSGVSEGLLINDWNSTLISKNRFLQEGVLNAVFNQFAVREILSEDNLETGSTDFYEWLYNDFLEEIKVDTNNRLVIYNWIYVKRSLDQDGIKSFLQNVILFMEDDQVNSDYDLFKTNLLIQAISVIRLRMGIDDLSVVSKIYSYIDDHMDIEAKVKLFLLSNAQFTSVH